MTLEEAGLNTCSWKGRWETGYRRGYIPAKSRGVPSELHPVPESIKGLRGNFRWAMGEFLNRGCTHYYTCEYQHTRSSQYCYTVYYGVILEREVEKK